MLVGRIEHQVMGYIEEYDILEMITRVLSLGTGDAKTTLLFEREMFS